jgi:hypothetical protein
MDYSLPGLVGCYRCGKKTALDGVCQHEACGYIATWRLHADAEKERRQAERKARRETYGYVSSKS